MNVILLFLVVSIAVGVRAHNKGRPFPQRFMIAASVLTVLMLYSQRAI